MGTQTSEGYVQDHHRKKSLVIIEQTGDTYLSCFMTSMAFGTIPYES
jgi:hypothetical protein